MHGHIRSVKWIDEVLEVALTHMPESADGKKSKQIVEGEGATEGDARNSPTTH